MFGNATILTVRAGGWWEPNESYTSVVGDLVTPSHTDNFTGLCHQGRSVDQRRQSCGATRSRRRLERYIAGQRAQHSLRFGLQLERAHAVSQSAFPSGVQFYDFNGAPDYALFSAPSVQGAGFNTQGVWAEDQMTVGNRADLHRRLALRPHDRGPAPTSRRSTTRSRTPGRPLPGSATCSPGTCVVAAGRRQRQADRRRQDNPSRHLRPRLPSDPAQRNRCRPSRNCRSHPAELQRRDRGIHDARFRHQHQIEPQDRSRPDGAEVRHLLGWARSAADARSWQLNASYVHKSGSNIIGWQDIGGIYGQGTTVLPDGRSLTVFPILNSPSARVFLRTNRPDYSDTYDAVVTSLVKRMSQRWQGQLNLTLGRSEGLRLTGATLGRDPNDVTNATGRLNPTDRPVMFGGQRRLRLPKVDVLRLRQLSEPVERAVCAGGVGGAPAGPPKHQHRRAGSLSSRADLIALPALQQDHSSSPLAARSS